MNTIFAGLTERAISLGINITTSGWILENTSFPHISIQQIASIPWQENSLISRIEENRYQFSIYTDSFDSTQDYLNTLKENFAFGVLDLDYRRFSSMQYDNHMFQENVPGIFHGVITFIIYTERDYNANVNRVSSLKFYDGIKTINDTIIKSNMVLGFQLENDKIPYISISNLNSVNNDAHSKGLLNSDNFSFHVYDSDLNNLELTIEKIHTNYDYCCIDVLNYKNLTVQWLMTNITEIEQGIWSARMDYTSMIEELIDV